MFRSLFMTVIDRLLELGVGDTMEGFTTQGKIENYRAALQKRL